MIGNKIKELRLLKKLNQQDLAKALGVSKSSVAMWEVNKREPVLAMVGELSRFFNVPTAFLLGTGVFNNWEEIAEKKDIIIDLLLDAFPNFQKSIFENKIGFIHLINTLFDKIIVNDQGGVDLYINNLIKEIKKSIAPAEASKDDANKQKLMDNYDLLNDEGQQDLVDYSDMLAGNPRKLKESDTAVSVDA